MDETTDRAAGGAGKPARPAAPTTAEELKRSLTVIRFAIAVSIVTIGVMTWLFIAFLDAPAVPLLPLAILVVVVDLVMLGIVTRRRRQAIERISREHSGLPG